MADATERMRLQRNPRAARIDFIMRKAAAKSVTGDVRDKAWGGAGGAASRGGGGGGRFNRDYETNIQ